MYKDDFLIMSTFFSRIFSKWYGFSGGLLLWLDLLLQKFIRHNYHKQNYERSLCEETGLKIDKKPAFQPISDNFYQQWNTVLYDTEKADNVITRRVRESNRDCWNKYYAKDGQAQ